jgi:hypothetical protein
MGDQSPLARCSNNRFLLPFGQCIRFRKMKLDVFPAFAPPSEIQTQALDSRRKKSDRW